MTLTKKLVAGAMSASIALSAVIPVFAASANLTDKLEDVNSAAGLGDQDLMDTLGLLINVFLGFLGVICLVLVIYAGFLWMTAGGDDTKVKNAKSIMINALIGLIILLSAFAISSFVLDQLSDATGTGG